MLTKRQYAEQAIGAVLLLGWGTLVILLSPIDRLLRRRDA